MCRYFTAILLFVGLALGCKPKVVEVERHLNFDEFAPRYNDHIKNWLANNLAETEKKISEIESDISASGSSKLKEDQLMELKRERSRYKYRQGFDGYFSFKSLEDLPKGLIWEEGLGETEFGDPRAKKGGTYRSFMVDFPATLRPFGPNANNRFRDSIYAELSVGLVGLHPKTKKVTPGLAKSWAIGEDNKTVFYKLDPDARFNNGDPVLAKDFMVYVYLRVSDFVATPFQKQYFREQLANITIYDDYTFSVSLPEEKPFLPLYASLSPSSSRFYKDYGPDYTTRYQWKIAPTTGPYYVKDEDVVKGVSVTLTRLDKWWADDKKYHRYHYNPSKIVYTVIRDESKAFELFRAGEIDSYGLTGPAGLSTAAGSVGPEYWYQKSEIPPVFDGYIERFTFYNQYPRTPWGIYFNTAKPLVSDIKIRRGIQHALNWQKVIDVMFRGDATRLENFSTGYGIFQNPEVKAPRFNIKAAREYFEEANFTEEGSDGILRRKDGTKLSLSITYAAVPLRDRMMAILKEEAIKCGLELVLDGLEPTVNFKKISKKEHQLAFMGWGVGSLVPSYYQFFHSANAFDEKGNPKPNTNNVFSYANDEMDKLSLAVRFARNEKELQKAAWRAQKIIIDEAIYSPGYQIPFVRESSWRWIRWPETKEVTMSSPTSETPLRGYSWWIDEDIKEDTLKARREGKTFPEIQKTIYRPNGNKGGSGE